jgi:hypothetical protein
MARRKNVDEIDNTQDEATEEVAPTEEVETKTESTEETLDLTGFEAVVAEAIEGMDVSTGEVPPTEVAKVNEAYRSLDGQKGKAAARTWLENQMKHALKESKDFIRARAFVMLKDGLSSAGGHSAPRPPADPTKAFVQKVAAFSLALNILEASVPENVSEDWHTQYDELLTSLGDEVETYQEYVNSDDEEAEEPAVSPVVRQAFKLATSRVRGGGAGSSRVPGAPRRDVSKHLAQVFADLEVGSFLKVNEIAKAASEEYGDDRPSSGAVSSRLFPKGKDAYSADGIEACEMNGARGARKVS